MSKGARLRALKANSVVIDTRVEAKIEPTIKSMKGLTRIKASEAPEGNRAQHRAEERADKHEAALAAQYPTNRTIWGRIPSQAFQRLRVFKREMGEGLSIRTARLADPQARKAVRSIE